MDDVASLQESLSQALQTLKRLEHDASQGDVSRNTLGREVEELRAENARLKEQVGAFKQQHGILNDRMQQLVGRSRQQFEASLAELCASIESECGRAMDASSQGGGKKRRPGPYKKLFVPRASKLTEMLQVPDYATIHNLGVTIIIMAGLNILIADYFQNGVLFLDLSLIWWCFGQFDRAAMVWCVLMAASFLVIPITFIMHHAPNRVVRWLAIALYTALQVLFYTIPGYLCTTLGFPPASGVALMAEQTRLSMKLHSYVREAYPAHRNDYPHSTISSEEALVSDAGAGTGEAGAIQDWENWSLWDEISSFAYFLVVPTLLYRRTYPRTYRTRYSFVIRSLLEVVAVIYFAYIVFRFVLPQFERSAREPFSWQTMVLSVFSSMMPAMMIYVMAFFALLHAWMNAFAELARFADRQFYQDWWNATSWAVFYRRWNGVVHDWIAAYLYRDVMTYFGLGRISAQLFAFAVSAVIHEYIIAVALGFFYPILLLMFGGPGVVFIALTSNRKANVWNIFMWLMLAVGNGLLMVLYSREWYAQKLEMSCFPQLADPDSWAHYLPRSWLVPAEVCASPP